jgi:SAM-dependent methyltransferase
VDISSIPPKALERWLEFQQQVSDTIYPEPHIVIHEQVIRKMIDQVQRMGITGKVLDMGCGNGYALKKFLDAGYDAIGITLGDDYDNCLKEGLPVEKMDQNWMAFEDETFDLVWARHVLEHSIMPVWTLSECNRILKSKGYLYVEVPGSESHCKHEYNPSHWSVLGTTAWECLLERTGFQRFPTTNIHLSGSGMTDTYYAFMCRKIS